MNRLIDLHDTAFHHLGLAVRRPERAAEFLRQLGYQLSEPLFDPQQQTNLILCRSSTMPCVEIIFPATGDGPLTELLTQRNELIYHVCYEVSSSDEFVDAARQQGIRILPVSPPKPAVLFGGRHVSFYLVHGFGLIELLER